MGGIIGWTFDNYGTVDGSPNGTPMYTVTAQVGDSLTALKAASSPLAYSPALDAPIASDIGDGRYLRVSYGGGSYFCIWKPRFSKAP